MEEKSTRDQVVNIRNIVEKCKNHNHNIPIYLCFSNYAKAFDCVGYVQLWKIMKQMGVPLHIKSILQRCSIRIKSIL